MEVRDQVKDMHTIGKVIIQNNIQVRGYPCVGSKVSKGRLRDLRGKLVKRQILELI